MDTRTGREKKGMTNGSRKDEMGTNGEASPIAARERGRKNKAKSNKNSKWTSIPNSGRKKGEERTKGNRTETKAPARGARTTRARAQQTGKKKRTYKTTKHIHMRSQGNMASKNQGSKKNKT